MLAAIEEDFIFFSAVWTVLRKKELCFKRGLNARRGVADGIIAIFIPPRRNISPTEHGPNTPAREIIDSLS
jgi:hypothetical protein